MFEGSTDGRKVISVVFADLVGSTAVAERLDPESTRQLITHYFADLRSVVERHGGTVEKFIGDAVMAVFGIPVLHEDDALRAVRAAAEMRAVLDALNDDAARYVASGENLPRLAIRIGVESGEAAVGHDAGGEQLATGLVVNTAARLEQIAQPGDVLLGPGTMRLVRGVVVAEPVGHLALKGISESIESWRLVHIPPDAQTMPRREDTPFVGRHRELASLEDTFRAVVDDAVPRLVTIAGAPGLGKSRLAAELWRLVGSHAVFARGRCLPYGESVTWSAVRDILQQTGAGIAPAAGDEGLPGTTPGDSEAGLPEDLASAFRSALETVARQAPVVVIVEDVHWADPMLLDLLEYVLTFASGPILFVCLTRLDLFETRPSWAAPTARATTIRLDPLADADTARLVDRLAELHAMPLDLGPTIVERAGGNPLFVEQLIAHVAGDERTETGASVVELETPPTIHALLAARIDVLPADERSVLQAGSVEGSVFRPAAVAELLPDAGRAGFTTQLMSLVRKEFVAPERALSGVEEAFRFNHVLIRNAAYELMSKSRRADLHQRMAVWLDARLPDHPLEADALAHHLDQAYRYRVELAPGDPATIWLAALAARRLAEAGVRAGKRGEAATAVRLLERAAALLENDRSAYVEVLPDLGRALSDDDRLVEARQVLDEAIAEARVIGDQRSERRAEEERWRVKAIADVKAAVDRPDNRSGTRRRIGREHALRARAIERLHRTGVPKPGAER